MKYLLLIAINFYWRFVPQNKRRHCIYAKSCSRHVYDITKAKGLFTGLKALLNRIKTCRPNHEVIYLEKENVVLLKLCNGAIIQQDEISENIVLTYINTLDNR